MMYVLKYPYLVHYGIYLKVAILIQRFSPRVNLVCECVMRMECVCGAGGMRLAELCGILHITSALQMLKSRTACAQQVS